MDPRLGPRRWWALSALAVATLVLGLDMTILNVALPSIAADLKVGTRQQQWMVDAFLVVFAAIMVPAGLVGDRFGRRLTLVTGLAVMLAGSVLGALAGGPGLLITGRAVMGLGAALVSPLTVAVLPALFGPAERAKAIAALTAAFTAGLPLGPLVGGWLLDHFWWGSVLLVNVPLVAVALAGCALLPETRERGAPRVDVLGAACVAGALGALVYGLIEGPSRGWGDPLVLAAWAASLPLLLLLIARERRREGPPLGLGLLRDPVFGGNALIGALIGFILAGLIFLLPQYLQAVRGHDAFGTGLRLLPLLAGVLVAARGCQGLVRQFGPRGVVATGLALLSFAGIQGSTIEVGSRYGLTAIWLTVTGLGAGLALVPATDAAIAALPPDHSGTGSGLLLTLRHVGSAIGVAVLGSLLAQVYRDRLDTEGLPPQAAEASRESVVAAHSVAEHTGAPGLTDSADWAFTHGMSVTLYVCSLAALGGALLAGLLLPQHRADRPGVTTLVAAEGDVRE
ncbi:MFS transporter [Streptomyces sp. NBC_01803]|uniref:MFS transporter n=1 Tax=Streptomyces sp. NBC_01803 TaxID=2975946 RepID=UPI002DD8DCAB|nr:MFS transporter [Streptomyces sp. NBC_01803]WSA45941.1 MFS transporter [Streptomyces sp. NBC_01803]